MTLTKPQELPKQAELPEWEKRFNKQSFCWTDYFDNTRKLHTNRDVTQEVKQFTAKELHQAQVEAEKRGEKVVAVAYQKAMLEVVKVSPGLLQQINSIAYEKMKALKKESV